MMPDASPPAAPPGGVAATADGIAPPGPGPGAVGAALAAAGALGLAGLAGHGTVTVPVAVGVLGVVLSWGWPGLVKASNPRAMSVILAGTSLALTAAAAVTRGEPYLRWVPAVVTVGVTAAFLHQLLRRDGRHLLTSGLAGTVGALALVASGAAMVPLPYLLLGPDHLAVAMTGLAFASLVELVVPSSPGRRWTAALVTVCAALAAAVFATLHGDVPVLAAAGVGAVCAYLAHSFRRAFGVLPASGRVPAQLALGSGSVLVVGVVVFVVTRLWA